MIGREPAPREVTVRLLRLAALAELAPERRLASKVDLSSVAVTQRLRTASQLRRLCLACFAWGRTNLAPARTDGRG